MKKIGRLFRGKRAFSPVIASLILMLLAVAAGVLVYAYVMGWLGGATQTPGGIKGELQFDSIWATASNDIIKIYVRNVGGSDLNLSGIYVEGTKFDNNTNPFTTYELTVGNLTYLEVDYSSIGLIKKYYYEVKVTCKDGTTVSQSVKAR